jgi:tetratricopeptide (TPR) repeat protein
MKINTRIGGNKTSTRRRSGAGIEGVGKVLASWVPAAYACVLVLACLVIGSGMFSPWSQLLGVVAAIPAAAGLFTHHSTWDINWRRLLQRPVDAALASAIGLLLISLVASAYHWASLVELLKGVALVCVFRYVSTFVSTPSRRRLIALLVYWTGVVYSASGMVLFAVRNSGGAVLETIARTLRVADLGRLSIGFGYANTLAAFLLVPISIGIGLAIDAHLLSRRIAIAVGILVMVSALLMTSSRGGFLVLGVVALGAPLLMARASQDARATHKALVKWYMGLTLLVGVVLAIPPLRQASIGPLLARLGTIWEELRASSALESSLRGRLTMSLDAVRYARAYPLFGSGAGTYFSVYTRFRTGMFFSSDPHSILLKVATETGIVGLGVFVFLVVSILRKALIAAFRRQDDGFLSIGILIGCAALVLHACIDWDFAFFGLPVLLAVLCGACSGTPVDASLVARVPPLSSAPQAGHGRAEQEKTSPVCSSISRLWATRATGAFLFAWAAISVVLLAAGLLQVAAIRGARSDPMLSIAQLRIAGALDPLNAEHRFRRALAGMGVDSLAPAGPISTTVLDVRADFERAIGLNPYYPLYRIEYARFLLAYRLPAAVEQYRTLVAIDPADPGTYTGLAAAFLTVYDNPAEAERWVTKALEVDVTYAEAHLVRGLVLERQERYDDAAAAYREAARLDPSSSTALVSLGKMRQAQGDVHGAMRAFFDAYVRTPDNNVRRQLEAVGPVVDVILPAAGVRVGAGEQVSVQWSATGQTGLIEVWDIYLIPQSGDWRRLVSGLPVSARAWTWSVPSGTVAGQYQVSVYPRAPSLGADAQGDWLTIGRSVPFTVDP